MRIIYCGGTYALEFKNMHDARSFKAFAQLSELAFQVLRMVQTVLDATSAHQYIRAGAQFISSPFLHKEMRSICEDYNIMWIPGCSTNEVVKDAIRLKADIINNVPALDVLRQSTRDFPTMYFVPSAGIELHKNNVPLLFEAGALCLRLGDNLFRRNEILTKDWTRMEINFYQTVKNSTQAKKSAAYNYSISA